MTGERSRSPEGKPDTPGVHSISHFALTVPDLTAAGRFYSSFGLGVREDGDRLALLASQCAAPCGLIVEGTTKRLNHLSFGIYESDAGRFQRRLEEYRIQRVDPPASFRSDGFWFRDPEGSLIELRVAAKTSPDAKSSAEAGSTPEGVAAPLRRSQMEHVRPRRLSHVLVFARDVLGQVEFYSEVLGLRLTDHSGDGIAFMHAPHGSDHHVLAFAKSGGPGFHHCSWDVPSVHHIGLGAMQMANGGFSAGWGLGRHVVGSNYFHYVRDPWGSYAEYSCDIDYVPKGFAWRPQDYPPEDAFYVWGPAPPADFAVNRELNGD
jgi:catechol 2,3-dioxygenase-like lactoylglutathione lyase family enzyme